MLVQTAFMLKPLEAKGEQHICLADGRRQHTDHTHTDNVTDGLNPPRGQCGENNETVQKTTFII